MKRLFITLLSSALLTAAFAGTASATTLKVCLDADQCFTSIQAAIDAATEGDKIKIAAGTYQGSLVIDKDIALDGAGAADTIITADTGQRVITTASGVSVLLKAVSVADPTRWVAESSIAAHLSSST